MNVVKNEVCLVLVVIKLSVWVRKLMFVYILSLRLVLVKFGFLIVFFKKGVKIIVVIMNCFIENDVVLSVVFLMIVMLLFVVYIFNVSV